MGRKWKQKFQLPNGNYVGYSVGLRDGTYQGRFEPPDDRERMRVSLGTDNLGDALKELAQKVLEAYGFVTKSGQTKYPKWDEVVTQLEQALDAGNNRAATFRDYQSTIKVLRATVKTDGPHDVDEAKARQFERGYLGGTYTRGGKKRYPRSASTYNATLRKLRSLWKKWLVKRLKLVTVNPWQALDRVSVDEPLPFVPEEGEVTDFLTWLRDREFPGWDLPILFIQAKAALGCRLNDIVSLKSEQLVGNVLTFTPEQRKARQGHATTLPQELADRLHAAKGAEWLWGNWNDGLRACRKAAGRPCSRLADSFTSKAFYSAVQKLFGGYRAAMGLKRGLRSHDFRRRAVTKAFERGYDVDTVALMFGLEPQTVRLYYLAWHKLDVSKQSAEMGAVLLPLPKPPEAVPQSEAAAG